MSGSRKVSDRRPLDIASLSAAYAGGLYPAGVVRQIHRDIRRNGERPVWICLVPEERALARVEEAQRRRAAGDTLPLFGIPFAVKDNIDVAGMPTTAACPAFAYVPDRSATVVEKLEAAGAILIGKTNLDQFATGLVGTRTPYGIPSSVFDADYISGGSSSGSAVAVAAGLVSFALGTDTAGSGRVPAAFNNIVGLKPTKGWLSTRGVVPACRSQDCVSVFAGSVEEALAVAQIAAGFDPADPFSRTAPKHQEAPLPILRVGVPSDRLEFFGDTDAERLYADAVRRLEDIGATRVPFDFTPFREAASLLYSGPWVAERLAAIEAFAADGADAMHPVVRDIICNSAKLRAVDTFKGLYRLAELTRQAESEWSRMDAILLPTTGTTYRIAEVLADPIRLNSTLGTYTNFVNLMDLSAIAVPAGFRPNGLPFGVSLIGRAFDDARLASVADWLHRIASPVAIGATGHPVPEPPMRATPRETGTVEIAVIGAHLSGQVLNHQLTERGARLVRAARTARGYSLYALTQGSPARPGLVFDGRGHGGIELEIWALPSAKVGSFLAEVAPPLGIGTVRLEDGTTAKGFLCEAYYVTAAEDITLLGGWRAYLARTPSPMPSRYVAGTKR